MGPANTPTGDLLADGRFAEAVLTFLKDTKGSNVKEGLLQRRGTPGPPTVATVVPSLSLPFSLYCLSYGYCLLWALYCTLCIRTWQSKS